MPADAPVAVPRAIVICVPPATTEMPMMRVVIFAGGGLSSFFGVGSCLCGVWTTTTGGGGLYDFGVSSLIGTTASGGRNATCAGKSLLPVAALPLLNVTCSE